MVRAAACSCSGKPLPGFAPVSCLRLRTESIAGAQPRVNGAVDGAQAHVPGDHASVPEAVSRLATAPRRTGAHAPPLLRVSAGEHSWERRNPAGVLAVMEGGLGVEGTGGVRAPRNEKESRKGPKKGRGEGESKHDFAGQEWGRAQAGCSELVGCWWLGEETRGHFDAVALVQNQTGPFHVPGFGRRLAAQVADDTMDDEGHDDEEIAQADWQEPLSCLTVLGSWELHACDVAGGWSEVLSVRGNGDCNVSFCRIRDVPMLGEDDPVRRPIWEAYDAVYNRTLPMVGIGKNTDGVKCFDGARARVRGTLFAESLHGGVRLFNCSSSSIANCTFAVFEAGVEAVDDARVAIDACSFPGTGCALLARVRARGQLEGCTIDRCVIGVSMHDAAAVSVRGCSLSRCFDGALYSGGEPHAQRIDLVGNRVDCAPNPRSETGFTWLSLQRPATLVAADNDVRGDPYYPGSLDLLKKYRFPDHWGWDRIEKARPRPRRAVPARQRVRLVRGEGRGVSD